MDPIVDKDGASLDVIDENNEALKALFPEAFTEGQIDFDVLKQLLGDEVDESEEKYGLNWHGKKKARQIALTPSMGTLRPCPEESVAWDTTQNLFIEGDNLEVLKLMQNSYASKVKMIYIDPPYNTGKEFIYPDRFQDNLGTYLRYTGQKDEEGLKVSSNTESSGRFHANWLNMMYPRLKLARNMLTTDGVIFITIDDHEVANLKQICDEIFGEENFVTSIAWQKKVSPANDAQWFSSDHDHILLYARNKEVWRPRRLPLNEKQSKNYTNPDNDNRGVWNSATYTCNKNKEERPNLYYPITNPNTGEEVWPKTTAVWKYSKGKTDELVADNRLYWGKDGASRAPRVKIFITESEGVVPRSIWLYSDVGHTQEGTKVLTELVEDIKFETPKPPRLIDHMLKICFGDDAEGIVLDFFAGSCATAQAVLEANVSQDASLRYIMVQLPEPIDHEDYASILDIGVSRIKKVASRIKDGKKECKFDVGFKYFSLDSSNLKAWEIDRNDIERSLIDSVDHLSEGRTEEDLVYELLLKRGVDLAVPIEQKDVGSKTLYSIGYGALFACLDTSITGDDIELVANGIIAWRAELDPASDTQVVFRDSAFTDDVAKTNMTAILEQNGIAHVRSL